MSYYIPLPICVYVCAARVVIFTDRVAHTGTQSPAGGCPVSCENGRKP